MSISKIKRSSILRSTTVVSTATAFSRVLGLVREQVMAYFFGASMVTDAFLTAFRIPNLLRDMFAEGALSAAFVPVFKKKLISEDENSAFHLASVLISSVIVVVGIIVVLGIISAPALIYVIANGFTEFPAKFAMTITMTKIMMVYLLLVSISSIVMGMLNSYGRFGIPALASSMFNLGVILTVTLLYGYFDQPAYTLAWGVVIGGVWQLMIQLPQLWGIGFRFKFIFDFFDEGLRKVVKLVTPMVVGLSAGRINILISTLVASFLAEGAISYLSYSYRLMHFPMGVFAVAIGTVALPRVSELVEKKDHDGLLKTFEQSINLNLLILIPSAIFLATMGQEIVSLVFQYGAFSTVDVEQTQLALVHYSYGLIGFATVRVLVPFYYGFGDSKTPMQFSIMTVVLNILLYYPMVKMLDFAGLAAATSIAGLLNCALLIYFLPRKGIKVDFLRLGLNVSKMVLAGLLVFYLVRFIPDLKIGTNQILSSVINLALSLLLAVVGYVLVTYLLGVKEVKNLFSVLLRKKS